MPNCITAIKLSFRLRRTLVRLHRYSTNSKQLIAFILLITCSSVIYSQIASTKLSVNDSGYFEKRGLNVFVFNDHYGLFGDEKASGIEIIHHGVRTATNGDVRLNPTPAQWDSTPQFIKKEIRKDNNTIEAFLKYLSYDFNYSVKAEAKNDGIVLTVNLDKPLPKQLEGIAGFNLEFLPAAYFHKTYLMDNKGSTFLIYPSSSMMIAYSQVGYHPGVGTQSKEIAYGNNRADFSFIAGSVVPGELILKPDFPENKEDWPFLWGENEYVVNLGASYIFLVNAVNDILKNER